MNKRTLSVDLWIDDDGNAVAEFVDGETGCNARIVVPFSPDEHPEFDNAVGSELHSWLTLMADQREEVK